MRSEGLALALVAAALWAAAVEAQTAQTPDLRNLDMKLGTEPDIEGYSSYRWNKDQVAVVNLANHIRLINAIQQQMKDLGYRIDTVKPEVLIQYRAERHTGVQTRSTQRASEWDPTDMKVQVELSREEQVTLSIEIVESESNFLLWQAKGTYALGTPDRAEKLINEAVSDLFAKYPRPEDRKK
ncbi:MAG: DUF4136 domain-containing protein [Vicinamibacteria bacterium]